MATNVQRLEVFQKTRQAVLDGELSEQCAAGALTAAGWSTEQAGMAVSVWKTLKGLRSFQTTDLERMAQLLRIPEFGEPMDGPEECPGFGRELPADWQCPDCPISDRCYTALLGNQNKIDE